MKVFSVSEYLQFLNDTLIALDPYHTIVIEGEVADYKVSQQKWIWFDLKDETGLVSCFATVWNIKQPVVDGMKVRITGYPKVYAKSGKMSFTVNTLELVGEGALKKAYELLKKKLETEGLFDQMRKRSLPKFPAKIALVTSPEAAAYSDFIRILNNRWGGVEIDLLPVAVQGQGAVKEITNAFRWLNDHSVDYDICVLTRGGGSLEDLIAFNSEDVARAVYGCRVPVVCGIGHERDECLAEYVADVRASTPSNAAELITPSRGEIITELDFTTEQMISTLNYQVKNLNYQVNQIFSKIEHHAREPLIRCHDLFVKLNHNFDHYFFHLKSYGEKINSWQKLLLNLDPKNLLKRGYSIVRSKKGIVRRITEVAKGEEIMVELSQGSLSAKISELNK